MGTRASGLTSRNSERYRGSAIHCDGYICDHPLVRIRHLLTFRLYSVRAVPLTGTGITHILLIVMGLEMEAQYPTRYYPSSGLMEVDKQLNEKIMGQHTSREDVSFM
jgi:hypothetical protein